MRLVTYLGTRGCPGVLEEALRDHFDELTVAVPAEPRLLGPELDAEGLEEGLRAVAEILAQRARRRALAAARGAEAELADVFDEPTEPTERIQALVLDPPLEQALAETAEATGAGACFVARDALDILDEAGVGLVDRFEATGVELRTR